MASPRRFPVFVIALFLVYFSQVVVVSADEELQPLIDKICRSLEPGDYELCNKVFNKNIGSPMPKDMEGLGMIAQVQALRNATSTHLIVRMQGDQAMPGSPEKIALDQCTNAYSVLSTQFRTGLQQFEQGKYADALRTERVTQRALGSCSSAFRVPPYPQNPLAMQNRQMKSLIDMAIATLTELSR